MGPKGTWYTVVYCIAGNFQEVQCLWIGAPQHFMDLFSVDGWSTVKTMKIGPPQNSSCSNLWPNPQFDISFSLSNNYRTPFHADVFRSYSWSTNVCGCKEWLLYPPGEEEHLCDRLGNLPFDVTSADLEDRERYPNASKACRPICVVQNAGETIFVPR